ncbi:GAF domain-containing protein [Cellulomonas composti]|uniref:Transcriptional regulator n=1 Tax=Cellulomonas composti TaxID=266130 RepID=A0A511JFC6_9CELL|nr:helix-turn-helix domain-containing protein [Cellulomonas composti]GEL96423.1 transcriptional regulator [Cellulomonas composti]
MSTETAAVRPTDVRAAQDAFVATGRTPLRVRRIVADSWRRSRRSGVDPEHPAPRVELSANDLAGLRRDTPLAGVLPVVRRLLLDGEPQWVAALTDASGRLLWVEGDAHVRKAVGSVGFVEGAVWSEDCAGTNAPGTALATNREVQVVGSEHWARPVQSFSCAAVPVHDTAGRVLGVLDLTGGPVVGTGIAMRLVRATASAIEASLPALPTSAPVGPPAPVLRVLGSQGGVVVLDGNPVRLSRRHAEIVLLLAEHPAGLTADELAVLLSESELSAVTVRAEVSRLRRIVGPLLTESRPYRLTQRLRTDVDGVRDALALGDVTQAITAYGGPVLPRSLAPGVARVREAVSDELRAAVLASHDPAVLVRWAASDEGDEDWQAWQALADATAPGSATNLRAHAHLARLDLSLGPRRASTG